MRIRPVPVLTLIIPLCATSPLSGATKVFKDTREFKSTETEKGYLNTKFDTYAAMAEAPKGTDCDWVFAESGFSLDEIRKAGLTLSVAAFAAHEDGYAGMGSLMGNPIVQSLQSSMGTMGIRVRISGSTAQAGTAMAVATAQAQAISGGQKGLADHLRANPQMLEMIVDQRLEKDTVGAQVELDTYNQEKTTLGVEEAAKRAEARKDYRRAKVRAQLLGDPTPAPPAFMAQPEKPAEAPKPADPVPTPAKQKSTAPEDQPGYQMVVYVLDSRNHDAATFITGISTNSTTAEFILLKDGKPLLAARHTSASMGWGAGSGAKCGKALASAFRIEAR